MTVGGGGGKKIPPGGPQKAPKPPSTPPSTAADPGKTEAPDKPAAAEQALRTDAFEGGFKSMSRGTTDVTRLDAVLEGAFAHASTPSGIESLVRMLEAARTQLAAEHRALREQAQSAVERLVQSGFSPAQLDKARHELLELRKKMAALRKRLHHLQRRLKTAFASAGKTGDANFAKLLGAQLSKLRQMEPGLSRALLALSTIEQAYGSFADGSTAVLRVHVGETGAGRLGDALAALAPGAAVSLASLTLLREGAGAAPPAGDDVDAPEALDGLRALTDALVPPGRK